MASLVQPLPGGLRQVAVSHDGGLVAIHDGDTLRMVSPTSDARTELDDPALDAFGIAADEVWATAAGTLHRLGLGDTRPRESIALPATDGALRVARFGPHGAATFAAPSRRDPSSWAWPERSSARSSAWRRT
jgi:hypothetical protein